MPKFLALEWDDHEIRLAAATTRGHVLVLEHADAVPLAHVGEGASRSAKELGQAIAERVAGYGLRRPQALVAVGRSSIELKELALPPAPDDDLPDLVRFQALREFNTLSDEWPLDFVPFPAGPDEPRTVLAGAISPAAVEEIRAVCDAAGLELSHLVLRPSAAAALLTRRAPQPGKVRLFVDVLVDEVDLTVLVDEVTVLMRTARLPVEASLSTQVRPLVSELRRTIAAVQNRLKGQRVEAIFLAGDGPNQSAMAEQISRELELPVELFDPFQNFELAADLRGRLPDHHSRFAPLLGLLADAGAGDRHDLDFLHPRRRPEPKSRRREFAIGAAAAAVVALAFSGWTWMQLSSKDEEIQLLASRAKSLDTSLKQMTLAQKDVAEIDRWMVGDVVWLDMLERMASKAPDAKELMLTDLQISPTQTGGAMLVKGLATGSGRLSLEAALRQAKHRVTGGKIVHEPPGKRYEWNFETNVEVVNAATVPGAKIAAKAPTPRGAK